MRIAVDAAKSRCRPRHGRYGDKVRTVLRAATAGDDYEIAFTAPLGPHAPGDLSRTSGVAIAEIGGWRREAASISSPSGGSLLSCRARIHAFLLARAP